VEYEGAPVTLSADEVIVTERPREGWSVVNEHGETIALDLHLSPELVRAGLAREAVRLVQEARKSSGLQVSDRIRLAWSAEGDMAEALRAHADLVSREVLAVEMTEDDLAGAEAFEDAELGLRFTLTKV
jgi:isoleucyl-tRNA synthetase